MEPKMHKNNKQKAIDQYNYKIADDIYQNLNRGGLYEINRIMNSIDNVNQKKCIMEAFREKYHFDFYNYI